MPALLAAVGSFVVVFVIGILLVWLWPAMLFSATVGAWMTLVVGIPWWVTAIVALVVNLPWFAVMSRR